MITKSVNWHLFSEKHPKEGYQVIVIPDEEGAMFEPAIFWENYDGSSTPGFYWELDENGDDVKLDKGVLYWAYVDFQP